MVNLTVKKETAEAVSFGRSGNVYFWAARAFWSQSLPSTKRETM